MPPSGTTGDRWGINMGDACLVPGPKAPGERVLLRLSASEQLAEPALVAAASRGDRTAWEILYRRLYPRLRAYVARRVDSAHVDDTVSETMVRAVRGIENYQPGPSGFDAWVFGIARRVCADHYRRRARLRRQDGVAAGMAEVIEEGRAPGDPAAAADERAELRRAFELLVPSDQQVLELRVVAGLSVQQAAGLLDKAPGAVRTAQSRALGRLRELIKTGDRRPTPTGQTPTGQTPAGQTPTARCISPARAPSSALSYPMPAPTPAPPGAVACSPAWGPNLRRLFRLDARRFGAR